MQGPRPRRKDDMKYKPPAQMALDTLLGKPAAGIPSWLIHPMEHRIIESLAGAEEGAYRKKPIETYLQMQRNAGTCLIDQWIPDNPLSIGDHGYEDDAPIGATTGARRVVCDGITIDSPESVAEHLERYAIPRMQEAARKWQDDPGKHAGEAVRNILAGEREIQELFGPDIVKAPYGVAGFPCLPYYTYGYQNYFMAYALYPDVMERDFKAQADYHALRNRAVAQAYAAGGLPPVLRLDHDIADSRGTLVDVKSLDRIWFPHFARSLAPILAAGVKTIWHCDGNLMQMVPRLLDAGLKGFQGFQYEDGMDYEKICRMKTLAGEELLIIGGVSVTRTLPFGAPADVKKELRWLVENGPRNSLFLAGTSSIAPGVSAANIAALVEGLKYYRENGRRGIP